MRAVTRGAVGEKSERVDNNGARLRGKRERLRQRGTYFLVLRHFVTGMDAGGPRTRRRLKLKQSSSTVEGTDSPERTG